MISWISSFFSCRCPLFDKEPILKRRNSETPEDLACLLMERIEEIHLRLTKATQTRVFEFRLERPEHFYEYQNVKTSLDSAQKILSGGVKKNQLLLANHEVNRAERALSTALRTRTWTRIR